MALRMWMAILMTLVGTALFPATATATQHDPCLHIVNGLINGQDAGNNWFTGNRMIRPINCQVEMDNNDPDDWFYIKVGAGEATSAITVQICPNFTSIAPWNVDLAVYFLPGGDLLPAAGASPLTSSILNLVKPGILKGESHNGPGQCDTVVATQDMAANSGRWYINDHRVGGQGGYILNIT